MEGIKRILEEEDPWIVEVHHVVKTVRRVPSVVVSGLQPEDNDLRIVDPRIDVKGLQIVDLLTDANDLLTDDRDLQTVGKDLRITVDAPEAHDVMIERSGAQ